MLDRPIAFVDLETTGATATHDRITEIGIVTWDGVTAERWSQLVNPESRIPPFIERLTGITSEMVEDQPTFRQIAPEVERRLAGHLFVAHNARFDYGFLKNEFKRVGIGFRMPQLCTVKLSRRLFPEHRRHNLDSLIERHNLTVSGRHRALADAEAIYQFWRIVRDTIAEDVLLAAFKAQMAHPALPAHLDPGLVDELPEGCGVYFFYGENDLPLYVGKSNGLRKRVLSHFAADHSAAKEMSLCQQVRRIEWIECGGQVEALLTEARLIKELQPILNRQLRRNREFCSWLLEDQGLGYWRPTLVYARDLGFGRQEHLYGLFKSAREATRAMEDIAKANRLCLVTLGLEKGTPGKPCFGRQIKQCKGACQGEESLMQHSIRLMEALSRLKLKTWPFPGPALLKENGAAHVIDAWCYLGKATSDEEIEALLAAAKPSFDRDTYRILVKEMGRMVGYRPASAANAAASAGEALTTE
ncbi:MAG: exonuclease domain-containing protein [Betaproteobacteria bacterium]